MADVNELSADQLRARIAQEEQLHIQLTTERENAREATVEATERQRLRRELDQRMARSRNLEGQARYWRCETRCIDQDLQGEHAPGNHTRAKPQPDAADKTLVLSSLAYNDSLHEREFVWQLSGLSWLPYSLKLEGRECTVSERFSVDPGDDDSWFVLTFSPNGGSLEDTREEGFEQIPEGTRGTLALVRHEANYGALLDVTFYVRGPDGDFTQLADGARVAIDFIPHGEGKQCCVLGPDLETDAKGLFGLPFDELLRSEWVTDDTITFKVVVKEINQSDHPDNTEDGHIFTGAFTRATEPKTSVDVPPPTLTDDLLAMLTEGRHSDLTVEAAYGDAPPVRFPVHSNILSLRSSVFRAALAHDMSESATRTVTVTDCPPLALQALLHFLYTDDFAHVEKVLREGCASEPAASSSPPSPQPAEAQRMAQLQAVLAAAHKYQVTRLLRWTEQQLCEHISAETVCSLLGLAHMYESPELEHSCLKFIKANMASVVQLPDFASLAPAVLVKCNAFVAGVEVPGQAGKKRKRE